MSHSVLVIEGREILHCTYNEGVRMGLVRGSTMNDLTLGLFGEVAGVLAGTESKPWLPESPAPQTFQTMHPDLSLEPTRVPALGLSCPRVLSEFQVLFLGHVWLWAGCGV